MFRPTSHHQPLMAARLASAATRTHTASELPACAGAVGMTACRRAVVAAAVLSAMGLSACVDNHDDSHLAVPSQANFVSTANAPAADDGRAQALTPQPVLSEAELEAVLMRTTRSAPRRTEPPAQDDAAPPAHIDACGCGGLLLPDTQ
jgi:hypothetical protein